MTLDELTTAYTRSEVEDAIYAALAALGASTTSWKPGSVARAIITGIAIVLAAFSELQAKIALGGFLKLAKGDWLTVVAEHAFFVTRDLGTFATSTITVDNTAGGVYSGGADDLLFRNSTTGKTYRNTAAYSIAALETGVAIPVQAVELGSGSNAGTDAIDTFETGLPGIVIVSSSAAVGNDVETDAALQTRCLEKTGPLSPNGPRDAYAFIAKGAKTQAGALVGVTRVKTVPDGVGGVDVYVATASGVLSGSAGDPATDLGAVAEAIHTQVEPLSITPVVQNATVLSQNVTYELWVHDTSGLSDSQLTADIATALAVFMGEHPIGGMVKPSEVGRIYVDAIEQTIGGALPDGIFIDVDVTVPAGDVDLTAAQVPILGTVSPTIHQVAGGAV